AIRDSVLSVTETILSRSPADLNAFSPKLAAGLRFPSGATGVDHSSEIAASRETENAMSCIPHGRMPGAGQRAHPGPCGEARCPGRRQPALSQPVLDRTVAEGR